MIGGRGRKYVYWWRWLDVINGKRNFQQPMFINMERALHYDIWGYVLIVIDTGCAMTPLPFSLIDTLIDMVYEILRLPF